jgi:hypothetical protein
MFLGLEVAAAICLLLPTANAQKPSNPCQGAVIQSIRISTEYSNAIPFDDKVRIAASYIPGTQNATVTLFGPILGSMDSKDVKVKSACTAMGWKLTSWIERSSEYTGAAAKNARWRPKIEVVLALRQPGSALQAIWRMRLTTGDEIMNGQTPGEPAQRFPIVLSTTLHLPGPLPPPSKTHE